MSKKSALLIGCNYFKTALNLDGCISDIVMLNHFFRERLYILDSLLLCDQGDYIKPTKENILKYLTNFILSAVKSDILFFAYAGASQNLSKDAFIVPCDYIENGYISGAEFRSILDQVPEGVTFFCISDTTYKSNILNLRYEIEDISTGSLIFKKEVSNGKKLCTFSKDYISKQVILENISEHETDASIITIYGILDSQKTGNIIWALIQTIENMHFYGIQLNHLFSRLQALIKFNKDATKLKMFNGLYVDLTVTFGRFVAGTL